jgi:molecular chaperone IbpA
MNNFDPFSFTSKALNTTIGFDQVFDRLSQLSQSMPKIPSYPPYNIKKVDENKYVIEVAVAGFGKQDLEIEMQEGNLTIKGSTKSDDEDYIYKGIADRAFTRSFALADSVEIKNADLVNGMLKIWLERFIPEEKLPKKIEINEGEKTSKQFLSEGK